MAATIAAMQALSEESALKVASGLQMVPRRTPRNVPPPCPQCSVQVAAGQPHDATCPSDEAQRLRATAVPRVIED